MGPLISLFWTSGDVCPGLQSQAGPLACVLPRLHAMDPGIKLCVCQNFNFYFYPIHQTRMHSSRMRTVRCSSLSAWGLGCLPKGCLPRGCLPMWRCLPRGESAQGGGFCQGGCLPRGCLPRGFVCLRRCLPRWGVCLGGLSGGVHISPLWTEFLTHTCENITFPQLRFRTVIRKNTWNHRWFVF